MARDPNEYWYDDGQMVRKPAAQIALERQTAQPPNASRGPLTLSEARVAALTGVLPDRDLRPLPVDPPRAQVVAAPPPAVDEKAVAAQRARIQAAARERGYEGADKVSASGLARRGISRVVKTGDGQYTDAPGAVGDVRYYDVLGNRADRNAPTATAGMTPAQWVAAQNAGPKLGGSVVLDNGERALGVRRRMDAEIARRNQPPMDLDTLKALSSIEANQARAEAARAQMARQEGADLRALNEYNWKEAERADAAIASLAGEAPTDLALAQAAQLVAQNPLYNTNNSPGVRGLRRRAGQQAAALVNQGDPFFDRGATNSGSAIPWDTTTVDPAVPGAVDLANYEIADLDGWNTGITGDTLRMLRYTGPVPEGRPAPTKILNAEEQEYWNALLSLGQGRP